MSAQLAGPTAAITTARGLSRRRRLYGLAIAILGAPLMTAALMPLRETLGLDTVLLAFVLITVAASALGGVVPATIGSFISFALANFFFAPPYGTFIVASASELADLLVFLAVTVTVGLVTELGARARVVVERDRVRAEWLAGLEAEGESTNSLDHVLAEAGRTYGADWVGLTASGQVLAEWGRRGDGETITRRAGDGLLLEVTGPERLGADLAPLQSLAATAGRLWRSQLTAEQARRAEQLARIDELRASLLAAVGHDLRGPLATIRASAATLADTNLSVTLEERAELLGGIEDQVARLDQILGNLLDLSRLQAGALSMKIEPTSAFTVLASVVRLGGERVRLELPDDLPLVSADGGLLERVLANLVSNAVRYEPSDQQVHIVGSASGGSVLLQVVDHGPGVAPERLHEIFRPFQHFSDRSAGGVGLGLAIARGFTEAMGARLTPSQTPGGGLTMTITLEAC